MDIKSESRLTFLEATGIIVGHGVGSGILSVPFLASRNTIWDFMWIIAIAFFLNVLLHLMIAELSYNNKGLQFVKCMEATIFKGKFKKALTIITFAFLGLSVLANCCSYITGSANVLMELLNLPRAICVLIYYVFSGIVVFFGMKIVGICEKYSLFIMLIVMAVLTIATFTINLSPLPIKFYSASNIMALYGMVSFALSSVMSVPTVVKGLNGDVKKIRGSIILGIGVNIFMIVLLTFITLLGSGTNISQNGAIYDLSLSIGGWIKYIGYIFTLFALSTSLWTNTLNLRDMIHEQTNMGLKISWIIASLPCLVLALINFSSFVGFARIASIIQVLTGLAIIVAYSISRNEEMKNTKENTEFSENGLKVIDKYKGSPICRVFGTIPFQILVVLSSIIATVGSILPIV